MCGGNVVVTRINNFNTNNAHPNFGAKTRSERQNEREKTYVRYVQVSMPEEDLETLEIAKKEIQRRRQEKYAQIETEMLAQNEEKQYRADVKELRETQKIIHDITTQDKDKNIFAGSTLQKLGKAADVVITATLSGMALHWSTGKAFSMVYKLTQKPKIAKAINNTKEPFKIVGSALNEGSKTAWNTFVKKVKSTKKGQELIDSKPIKVLNNWLNKAQKSYANIKADAKNVTVDNVRNGIATTFGVSGFVAGAVEKLDGKPDDKQKD